MKRETGMHHQAVTCRICRVVTAQGHAHCRVLAFLTLAVLFLPATAQTIPSAPPAGVWFADHHTLYRIDPATNGSSATVELKDEVEGLAVDPRDGAVWALSHKRLGKFDRAGLSLLDIHLNDLESTFEKAGALVLNPYQGDVWIAGKQQLLYLNQAGAKRLTWSAPDKIKAIALDLDETVWVLTKRGLRHVAEDGRTLSTLDLKPHVEEPEGLVVDGLGGLLWIIGEKALLRFDAHRLDQPPLRIPWSENQGEIETAASHPIFGTVWLVAKDALLLYNRSGTLIKQVDLKPHGLGEIEAMVFEPVSASLWLAGKKSVARFTGNGEYVARIELQELQKETKAIAAGPFTLAPSLTLIAPPDNTLTNNPAPASNMSSARGATGRPVYWSIPTSTLSISPSTSTD